MFGLGSISATRLPVSGSNHNRGTTGHGGSIHHKVPCGGSLPSRRLWRFPLFNSGNRHKRTQSKGKKNRVLDVGQNAGSVIVIGSPEAMILLERVQVSVREMIRTGELEWSTTWTGRKKLKPARPCQWVAVILAVLVTWATFLVTLALMTEWFGDMRTVVVCYTAGVVATLLICCVFCKCV